VADAFGSVKQPIFLPHPSEPSFAGASSRFHPGWARRRHPLKRRLWANNLSNRRADEWKPGSCVPKLAAIQAAEDTVREGYPAGRQRKATRSDRSLIGSPIASFGRLKCGRDRQKNFESDMLFRQHPWPYAPRGRGTITFSALLAKVKLPVLEAYEIRRRPFEKVLDSCTPQATWQMNPIFSGCFCLAKCPNLPGKAEQRFSPSNPPLQNSGISKFDLTVDFYGTPEDLTGVVFRIPHGTVHARNLERKMARHLHLVPTITALAPAPRIWIVDCLEICGKAQGCVVEFSNTPRFWNGPEKINVCMIVRGAGRAAGRGSAVSVAARSN